MLGLHLLYHFFISSSMLTGLFGTSAGTIFVDGKDIKKDLHNVRKSMGVCMQHDVLFSYLTTKEHLLLYGSIKVPHWTKKQLHEEVKRSVIAGMRMCVRNSSKRSQAVVIIPIGNISSQTSWVLGLFVFYFVFTSLVSNTLIAIYKYCLNIFNSGSHIAPNPLFLISMTTMLIQTS